MPNEDVQINVVATVRRDTSDKFVCVIRWVLGTGDELPHDDDKFDVSLNVVDKNGVRSAVITTTVAPRRFAMLDPPREERPVQYTDASGVRWLVAVKPTEPVDCSAADSGKLNGKAFGVCHLLKEAEPSRVAWRAAGIVLDAVTSRQPAAAPLAALAASPEAERSARAFGASLVASGLRPLHLHRHLTEAYAQLLQHARSLSAGTAAPLPPLLRLDGADIGRQFTHAALIMHALADRTTLETLDATVNSAAQTRKHVRIRALHGGELVDFWSNPDDAAAPPNETARGKRYPAAELIGSGCTIPIDADALRDWVDRKLTLVIDVAQHPRNPALTPDKRLDSATPGNISLTPRRGQYQAGRWPLNWTCLKRAQKFGSCFTPPPPTAEIDFSMNHADAAATKSFSSTKGPALNYRTGDGRVEILIMPPVQNPDNATIAAFNVYGMWEDGAASTKPYFDDQTKNPPLRELRPWLISRRYSYQRDLKEAFPDIGGARHPALRDILDAPPWQPILRTPERISDQTNGADDPLPNFAPPGGGVFAFDLRKGMLSGAGAPAGVRVGWDLAAPADTSWTPERQRDGSPLAAASTRPQRYRFWVTSVDAFEQESEPVAVLTNDVDAGEPANVLFAPVRRAPLFGPPGDHADESTQFKLAFDPKKKNLSVNFETPWETQISGRSDGLSAAATPRVDAGKIDAVVAIWRRRLSRPVERDQMNVRALRAAGPSLPDLPQWVDTHTSLIRAGWRLYRVLAVASPQNGDQWLASVALGDEQRGWEFIAGVGFKVKDTAAGFFAPNVLATEAGQGRRAVLATKKVDGSYESRVERVSETPRASDVALTQPLAVPNPDPARAPAFDPRAAKIWPARPVPPPPGVRRDLVLLRLLSQKVSRNGSVIDPAPWRDTDVALTVGQAVMCDTALARTAVGANPLPGDAPELKQARVVLAKSFAATAKAVGQLRQHPTLGFRGLIDLQWNYEPLEARPPSSPEAEAVGFRIYEVRVPREASAARNFATVIAKADRVGNEYRISSISKGDPDGWSAIANLGHPALARIVATGTSDPIIADLIGTREAGAKKYVTVTAARALPQGTVDIFLYAAQPLSDVETVDFDNKKSYGVLLPIGGGQPETFGWWVVGVSAQGRESTPGSRRGVIRDFESTLEPPKPAAFHVAVPTDFTAHVLDISAHRTWLPTNVTKQYDARYLPRLVLTWEALDPSYKAGLIVEREERQVVQSARLLLAEAPSPWQAIKAIEAASEGECIDGANIDAIAPNWLMGAPVEVEGSTQEPYEHVAHNEPGRRLDAATGLKIVPSPEPADGVGNKRQRPGFIDYYGRNNNRSDVMDSNWEFRYRLRAYLDLGGKLPAEWRYLASSPTEWSPWLLPETPPLKVYSDIPATSQDNPKLGAPRVLFHVIPSQVPPHLHPTPLFAARAIEYRWEYRLLLRRRLDVDRPNTGGSLSPVWIDIGTRSMTDQPVNVIDDEIDRGWPGHSPSFHYSIAVQQFLVVITEDGQTEKLVRGFETTDGTREFDVVVTPPTDPKSERQITKTIYVA